MRDEEAAFDALSLRAVDNFARPSSPRSPPARTSPGSLERLLRPRYLCFINSEFSAYETRRVETWMAESQTHSLVAYIFISYTRRQFYTQNCKSPELTWVPSVSQQDTAQRTNAARRDQCILTTYAIKAAEDAGVAAFWIDFECVQAEDNAAGDDDMEDVYRICDVVRGCHSMVIIFGPPLDDSLGHFLSASSSSADWLLDWGKRLWTLPEALLCPSEHKISIYELGNDEPEKIAKRNLPSRLWDDAATVRQLVEHYESSLTLTQLELISIALECLQRRQTEKRNSGDVAYALMGLLRMRPKVIKTDTDFQAFARLCEVAGYLANHATFKNS
jgi:hypothetical protein